MVTSLTQLQDLGKDLHAQYVSHTIDADMEEFFRYENQREPPSLSNQGSLRSGKKSDILECLKAPTGRSAEAKAATVVVLDMAAVVHMVRPISAHTFRDYVSQHLVPFVVSQVTPTVT